MLAPERIWWKPMGRMEKTWLTVALVWCIFLTIMMPLWYYFGKQNVPAESYRTSPTAFDAKVTAFVEKCKVGEDIVNGVSLPVVEACDGNDDRIAFGSGIFRDADKPATRVFLERDGDQLAFDLKLGGLELRRPDAGGDAATGTGLVHHVDRLVGQEAVAEMTCGELDGCAQRRLRVRDAVVLLVGAPQPLENLQGLGLGVGVQRTHVGFMGCHGAFNAFRVADAFATADPTACALVVCVELCSLHFQYGAKSDHVVANSIFADGAAALVLCPLEMAKKLAKPPVLIAGFGQATDTHTLQERDDPTDLKAVTLAAKQAFEMAKLKPSSPNWRVKITLEAHLRSGGLLAKF